MMFDGRKFLQVWTLLSCFGMFKEVLHF